jgi:hypothetical protein
MTGSFRIVIVKKLLQAIIGVALIGVATQKVHAVEPTWNYAVQVSAAVQESPAKITLTWPQDTIGTPSSYTVYRKSAGSTSWGGGTPLPGSATSYADTSVSPGTAYEYQVVKVASGYNGYGYVYAGINVPVVDNRGKVILVVDSSVAGSLTSELNRLQEDLAGDGWVVVRQNVARNDSAAGVKNGIKAAYNADPANVKAVFLFGHVPVPYSGNIVPDGHYPDHQGAWPADGYYGDMDGNWTDTSVYNTSATDARNRNVPGDGKFDQSEMPSAVELQVGRVDLANMPGRKVWGGPATFASEVELLRNYLNKDHNFRHKRINPPARGVIHDSFGVRGGEAFAASGYRSYAPLVSANQTVTLPNKGEWIPHLRDNSYLLAYGCGAGSYSTIGGLGNTGQYQDGTTIEVVENDIKAVFTMLFGSWLGDWDTEDNIMRSVLATRSMGLACSWSGRPHWYYHHLGLGETLGYATRLSQNNGNGGLYRNQINSAAGSIHLGLMGDPTLRLHPVAPPSSVSANSGTLTWNASPDSVLGYHVYRASTANGPFARITSSPVTGTSYTDNASGTFVYMVKAVKLQSSASGTYYNTSQGITTTGSGTGNSDNTPPTISINAPAAGTTVSGNAVSVSAAASDNIAVVGVQFKMNGSNLGPEDTSSPYAISWDTTGTGNGAHTLTAIARDAAGNQTVSSPLTVNVSNSSSTPPPTGEIAWVDDALPTGAAPGGEGESWNWVSSNPAPQSGGVAHQSAAAAGLHQHYFDWAQKTLTVNSGDSLYAYVYLDPANRPSEIMLQWNDGSWEHRAYWGEDRITYGANGTAGRRYMGALPAAGQWVRLSVPANQVGLEGKQLRGMAFSVFNGRATWDSAGAGTGSSTPPPTGDTVPPTVTLTAPSSSSVSIGTGIALAATASDNVGVADVQFRVNGANYASEDTSAPYNGSWATTGLAAGTYQISAVARDAAGNRATSSVANVTLTSPTPVNTNTASTYWVDDSIPSGGVAGSEGGDTWNWISSNPAPFSGSRAHQSALAAGLHQHWFDWASTLNMAAGETLFAHVYLDPANPPTELMLQWNDGSWEHRAYWGANQINYGASGTPSRRYMGPLPPAGQWVRLEVPASQVDLEGKQIRGMAFSLFGGRATWDAAGKLTQSQGNGSGPAIVSLTAQDNSATEGATDTAAFTFTRSGDLSTALTVQFTFSGTATKWNDYRRFEGDMPDSLVIPAGASSITMKVYAWPDTLAEGAETATLQLLNNSTYSIGPSPSASITIHDAGTASATSTGDGGSLPATGTNSGTGDNSTETPSTPVVQSTSVSVADNTTLQIPKVGDHTLRILSPTVLELQLVTRKDPDPAQPALWNFVDSSLNLLTPPASEFSVTVNGQNVTVQTVCFKRRPLYAPLDTRDLRLDNYLYLHLATAVGEGQSVRVANPSGTIIPPTMQFTNVASLLRYSPAIHVNQEGYIPSFPKKAMVGYYIGNLGELTIPTNGGFKLVDTRTGAQVFQGTLEQRADVGYPLTPAPYQKVYEADFTAFQTPGEYRLVVSGLGASLPFLIDNGIAMNFTRTYALGLYHQRCGTSNTLPYTRHNHDHCHLEQADVPMPSASYPFTWAKVAEKSADYANNPRHTAPQLKDETSQLYPIINRGKLDISLGHHDAGDYSKYTINSAGLVHYLIFAVDSFPGAAALDNLGLPESGDGISDLMQEAKWEADYLAKIQDADGGFYFLIYPREREYENNVTPDHGDLQVVWPKNTAATAAAVAALAQTASSPRFRQTYPAEAAFYLQKAQLGWKFLTNAIARFGKDGSYQKITHYGNEFMHDDELAWAATEMFLATGQGAYQQKLKEWYDPASPSTLRWGWWRMWEAYGRAARSYAFGARSGRLQASQLDATHLAKCQQQVTLCAQDQASRSEDSAYGTSFPIETKRVLSAGWYFSMERAFDIAVGYQLDPRAQYLQAFVANMNYEGGCNPVNVSYVTGLGWKRQREIVHQYALNDRRVLPPSGVPLGNVQSSFAYLDLYKSELNNMCFPGNDAAVGRYPFYDRWTDTHNVTTEFVHLDQARALAGLAFFATLTPAKDTPWRPFAGRIVVPSEGGVNQPITASLQVGGMDLSGARIVWEGKDQEPAYGPTYTFTPKAFGSQWIEAEAQWPDGRRVFAAAQFGATNHLPTVNVVASAPNASEAGPVGGSYTFTRSGDLSSALTVNYRFSGTATKWNDYRRSQGDVPEFIVFPAGARSVTLTIIPVVDSTVESMETATLTVLSNSAYNIGDNIAATVNIYETAVKISSITRSPSGEVTLTWNSQLGKLYQVNCKDSLEQAGWRTLQSNISASGVSTSYTDRTAASASRRFYAVVTT